MGENASVPKHKPLRKCHYCPDGIHPPRDAFWTVRYRRHLFGMDEPLEKRDYVCDEHLARACCRASSSKVRVYRRFVIGHGGMRIMPNGVASSA